MAQSDNVLLQPETQWLITRLLSKACDTGTVKDRKDAFEALLNWMDYRAQELVPSSINQIVARLQEEGASLHITTFSDGLGEIRLATDDRSVILPIGANPYAGWVAALHDLGGEAGITV